MKPFCSSICRAAAITLLASGLGLTAATANAQQSTESLEEIVILEAPVEVRYPDANRSVGSPREAVELRRRVSYADLDLTRSADVNELEDRIDVTAEETCERLAEMFSPYMDSGETRTCVRRAVAGASDQLENAIAMATASTTRSGQAMHAATRAAHAAERAAQAAKVAAAAAQAAAKEARAARKRTENIGE